MKILHTSDWHLGQSFYTYDRTSEHLAMLDHIADIVRQETPDIFLLSGDVFHVSQPSAAVQSMLSNALMRIKDANPDMVIVMTAGNHDSSSKHDIFRTPWQRLGVYTFGAINSDDICSHIVEVPGKAFVIAVPYAHERNIPEGFWQSLLDEVSSRNQDNLPVVMMAHTTVVGCDYTGHESASQRTVGGIDAIGLDTLGCGYDYLALGHIHHPQTLNKGPRMVRYCGTPLPVSFDETYTHSVSIVEIDSHDAVPTLRKVEIVPTRDVVTLPTKGYASWEEALQLLKDFDSKNPAYIRLNVQTTDFLPANAYDEAMRSTIDKACRFCYIHVHNDRKDMATSRTMTIEEFRAEDPLDIMSRYANDINKEFNDDLKALFREVITQINEKKRL